jgi:SAM-dependent methyltransferase
MTTLPPEEPRPAANELHQYRRVAESFGMDAERYDRARPRYPEALVNRIVAASPGREVLDVGCGTGIEARQFAAAGCHVLGIEPDKRMAAFAQHSGVDVEVATFEAWEPAGRVFDTVVAGQSWHWVDPASGPAKAVRVLRPGGRVAVFGHVFQPPAEVADAATLAYRRVAPDSPFNARSSSGDQPSRSALQIYQTMFSRFADHIREVDGFEAPEQWRFDWEQPYSRDEWLDLLPTTGGLTQLPSAKLHQILDAVGVVIDAIGGSFTMPHVTLAVTAARTDTI